MYVPEHFAADANTLIARLARRWSGVLVTIGEDGAPVATHMPILWDGDNKIATGHVARANPSSRRDRDPSAWTSFLRRTTRRTEDRIVPGPT
jgi:predicted FMN-binding regulatory protein PaiB